MEFTLELNFEDEIIKLEHVKEEEIFQRIKRAVPGFPLSKNLIDQYIELMKQQELNKTIQFLVVDGKFKTENWFKILSTRII